MRSSLVNRLRHQTYLQRRNDRRMGESMCGFVLQAGALGLTDKSRKTSLWRMTTRKRSSSTTRPSVGPPRSTSKRKIALFVGYDGAPYHGIQRNVGVKTVMDVLEPALHAADIISDENFGSLEKINWSVAARTDKGVSSAGNVIGLKARFPKSCTDELDMLRVMTESVNSNLPDHIRVFRAMRVTSSFSARLSCDERSYEYLLPVAALSGSRSVEEFADILRAFCGSHSFHNYTVGTDHCVPPRAQAHRVVREIGVEERLVRFERDGETGDWVRIRVRGQSFMLHQIRKMIAMAILVHHGYVPENAIEISFRHSVLLNCPPAPATGLFLDYCAFHSYNQKQSDTLARPVGFEEFEEEREKFKNDVVFPSIVKRAMDGQDLQIFFQTVHRYAPTFQHMCAPSSAVL